MWSGVARKSPPWRLEEEPAHLSAGTASLESRDGAFPWGFWINS